MANTSPPGGGAAFSSGSGDIEYKLDLHGSVRRLAFDSSFNTLCVRRGIVRDITDTAGTSSTASTALNEAIQVIIEGEAAGGDFTFPDDTDGTGCREFFNELMNIRHRVRYLIYRYGHLNRVSSPR